jgi:DNA segregation ATPase FtsK/SpoIIIE, S-DNA-T family
MQSPSPAAFEGTPEQQAIQRGLTAKLQVIGCPCFYTRMEIGPVITSYFFIPYPTTSLAKILSKTEDLALSVGAESILVRRELDAISISVPNRDRTIISFDKCLWNLVSTQRQNTFQLPMLMGVDCKGSNIAIDLCGQPHVLVAGSTGSGKSVFLSQLITSLAVMKKPSELNFILVDTKKLDLVLFQKLPHVSEVVTNIEDLHDILDYLLTVVRERTSFLEGRARNIQEWNSNVKDKKERFHYKVLVIDELADIIGLDKELARLEDKDARRKRIATKLTELAQISRAVGIHIIAATQRPSVQVISGDIKTNFPTRICFKLPSGVDSRVVLDENGAEALLGKGDYLYKTSTDSSLKRAHSAFVQMEDIKKIVEQSEYIRQSFQYN